MQPSETPYHYLHRLLSEYLSGANHYARMAWLRDAGLQNLIPQIPDGLPTNTFVSTLLDLATKGNQQNNLRNLIVHLRNQVDGHPEHTDVLNQFLNTSNLDLYSSIIAQTPEPIGIGCGAWAAILAVLLLVLAGALLQVLYPYWTSTISTIAAGVLILVLVAIIPWLVGTQTIRTPQKSPLLGSILVGIVIVFGWIGTRPTPQGTVYFIVDASENMRGIFSNVEPTVRLAMAQIPENLDVGLMMMGNLALGAGDCDNATSLLRPQPQPTSLPTIEERLADLSRIPPQGRSNLQGALLKAISQDLAGRAAVQQIVVITSGVDTFCGQLDPNDLAAAATTAGIQYTITIITIGPQSPEDQVRLEALAIGGQYRNLTTIDELPVVIPTLVNPPRGIYGAPYGAPYGQ